MVQKTTIDALAKQTKTKPRKQRKEATMNLVINWEVAKTSRTGRGPSQRSGVKLVNYMMKDGRRQACLTIYEDSMKRMRWAIGDRLLFAPGKLNGKDCVGIRRVPSGGKAISPASSAKGLSEKLSGKSVAGACRWATETFTKFGDAAAVDTDLIETDDGTLVLMVGQNGAKNG
jgi:hypothetical protein